MEGTREIIAPQAIMLLLSCKMKYVTVTVVKLDTSKPEHRKRMIKISEVRCEENDEEGFLRGSQLLNSPTTLNQASEGTDNDAISSHEMSREESVKTRRLYEAYRLRPEDDTSVKVKVFGSGECFGHPKPEVSLLVRTCCFATFIMHFTDDGEISQQASATLMHGSRRNQRIHLLPDEVGNRRVYRQRDRPAVIQFWPIFSFLNNEEDAAYSALVRCVSY